MKKVIPIWKPVGWTPLDVVRELKKTNVNLSKSKISYAGRLDPMAEGILLLLVDEENKKRHDYEDLEKIYESEIVLGISTDSFDGLGIIENIEFKDISREEISKYLKYFLGKQKQFYPPYSSKAVNGKPLYWWAKNKKLHEIEIPNKEIEIYSIELLEYGKINFQEMVEELLGKIKKVKGDFRQEEIMENWNKYKNKYKNKKLIKIKIKVNCSSGTYIRSIANELGKSLGNCAFAYSIKRTQMGDINVRSSVFFV